MFKMTDRARAAKVRREWYCDDCGHQWNTVHDAGADEDYVPVCLECEAMAGQVRRPVGIKTNASRAVDFAHNMAEQDYGLTDMNDNTRAGESVVKGPAPIQTAEAQAMARELVAAGAPERMAPELEAQAKSFFSGNVVNPNSAATNPIAAAIPQTLDAARAMAAPGVHASRGMRADPLGLLHEAGKKGLDPTARGNLRNYSKSPIV